MTLSPVTETDVDVERLCSRASELRDRGKGRTVSFSPKIFIPLTRLCRDFCGYCTYRQSPSRATRLFMTPDEVVAVVRAGERHGCRECLFVLGERPEERYPQARRWLRDRGYESSLEYLLEVCRLVLDETALYPHSNPGTMTLQEMADLREVNASMGMMLESASERLHEPGGPHEYAPSKRPQLRLEVLRLAGRLKIPFTTGLLIGIGETLNDRIDALNLIRDIHHEYGHIQEVIIQNFRAKPNTPMARAGEPSLSEVMQTAALARTILGEDMNIQVPPNLSMHNGEAAYLRFLKAGISDWGGISPLTIDYVNPEAPWPHLVRLKDQLQEVGFELRPRFAVYPHYIVEEKSYLPPKVRRKLEQEADREGYLPAETVFLSK